MKAALFLLLSAMALGQAPAPTTAAQMNNQNADLIIQRQALLQKLKQDPLYQQYMALQGEIDEQDRAYRIKKRQEDTATRQAAHEAAAKAQAEQAKETTK